MVQAAGAAAPPRELELPEPTWGYLARRGVPTFAVEGVAPVLVFYGGWKLWGLTAGILVATAVSAVVVSWQGRRGREAGIAKLTLVFLALQAVVGLASHSATVYLAQPVVLSVGWGIAHFVSVALGRPLVGLFANAWYPFPPAFRASVAYRRVFGLQSVVWGVFMLARAALRLAVLLESGVGGFVVLTFLTGAPALAAMVAWCVWHARRSFSRLEPEHMFA